MSKKSVLFTLTALFSLIAGLCAQPSLAKGPACPDCGLEQERIETVTFLGCGDSTTVTLYAGQHIDAGTVTVWNDETDLYVRYEATGGWQLTETHLAVATSLDQIPQKNGNPIPGRFPYKAAHDPPVTEHIYVVPLDAFPPGVELFIAAHAAMILLSDQGEVVAKETGWGDGYDFPGKNWATYFNFTVQPCEDEGGKGCTLTQGYWRTHSIYGPAPYDVTWATVGEDTPFFSGGDTWYEAIWKRPRGDAYYILAKQYIASVLNVNGGASTPAEVRGAMGDALMWFDTHEPGVPTMSPDGQAAVVLARLLDDYNNGRIGPGHCE